MKVSIIGSGTVGRATGMAFVAAGHDVLFYDVNRTPLRRLPNFTQATQDLSLAFAHGEALVLCLPTPCSAYGVCDTSIFEDVIDDLAREAAASSRIKTLGQKLVVQKSTMPPGTARRMVARLNEGLSAASDHLVYVVNPEFLNAGTPLQDACSPTKVVLGVDDLEGEAAARKLYHWLPALSIYVLNYEGAEFAKYANNLFHALLISMWNELYLVAEHQAALTKEPIDMDYVARLTAMEPGLESVYRVFGKAWGGACLPKDTRAFLGYAREVGFSPPLTDALIRVNELMRAQYGEQTKHWHELHPVEEV